MDNAGFLEDVGATALGVARVRAEESHRADRLFRDPYAEAFLAAAPGTLPESHSVGVGDLAEIGVAFFFHGIIRTRFFDDYLQAAARAGCRQVVLLAAGLDTRAFRLSWPDKTRLFELDTPAVLGFKHCVLDEHGAAPRCDRRPVEVDLRHDWASALASSGLDAAQSTAWLAEGLLTYLTAEEAHQLLTTVRVLSAPGSQLALEGDAAVAPSILAQARQLPAMQRFTALWKGGLGADPAHWLLDHGWTTQTHDLHELAAAYSRPAPTSAEGRLITAGR
ncbi:MAG: SAM-dependent methyltransferase [Nocardioidaceae bacterium]